MLSDGNRTIMRFSGFSADYKKYRPVIPQELIDLIRRILKKRPSLVVDLGCGAGDSTVPWSWYSEKVVGIEPSSDMLRIAKINQPPNVEYLNRYGHDTGLDAGSADLITCSSSLHWMEPKAIAAEIDRILRPGGVFCSYGYYYPFISESWLLSMKVEDWRNNGALNRKANEDKYATQFDVNTTMQHLKEGGVSYIRKIYMHSTERWDLDDFVGYINLYPDLANSERDNLVDLAYTDFGDMKLTVVFTYSIWIGVK